MITNKAYKFRIYPNKSQSVLINKTIGSARFIYNKILAENQESYEKIGKGNIPNPTKYKKEFEWLKEVDSLALTSEWLNVKGALQNFFTSLKKKRKGKQVGFPKFKSKKKDKESYTTHNQNGTVRVDFEKRKLKLPKLGWINYRDQRTIQENETIKSATISKSKTGKYFVSILVEFDHEHKGIKINKNTKVVGLDFSMSNFFVDNQGKMLENPKFYRNNQEKLAKLQGRVPKKKLGSKNRAKAQKRVNKVFEKITNSRKDWIHKLSSKIVNENDVIIIEDINLQAMSRCLNFGKSIHDLGFGEFRRQLEYKSLWYHKLFFKADKWFASSQICSSCGFKNTETKNLSVREWTCTKCGTFHHRDQNAAQNLAKLGFEILGLGQPDIKPVEMKDSLLDESLSVKQEALKSSVSG